LDQYKGVSLEMLALIGENPIGTNNFADFGIYNIDNGILFSAHRGENFFKPGEKYTFLLTGSADSVISIQATQFHSQNIVLNLTSYDDRLK
jgi:hypothetical protein